MINRFSSSLEEIIFRVMRDPRDSTTSTRLSIYFDDDTNYHTQFRSDASKRDVVLQLHELATLIQKGK